MMQWLIIVWMLGFFVFQPIETRNVNMSLMRGFLRNKILIPVCYLESKNLQQDTILEKEGGIESQEHLTANLCVPDWSGKDKADFGMTEYSVGFAFGDKTFSFSSGLQNNS